VTPPVAVAALEYAEPENFLRAMQIIFGFCRTPEEIAPHCVVRGAHIAPPPIPSMSATTLSRLSVRPDAELDRHFAAPLCRNCGATLDTPFCAQCGQPRAKRFGVAAVGSEAWQNWRWFELDTLRSALRLIAKPGTVAREFVLGARKKHVHPLKLLLVAIGLLLLVLAQSRYLDSADANLSRVMALVRDYAKWSFSLGIVAIFSASMLVFRRRLGHNATEHLVLATYIHFLIVAASVINLLPTLVWHTPAFLAAHKAASTIYMNFVEAAIVMLALRQFFLIELPREAWRLLLAGLAFAAIKWLLLRLYAMALVKIVIAQTT
jgi:hypothetical protein